MRIDTFGNGLGLLLFSLGDILAGVLVFDDNELARTFCFAFAGLILILALFRLKYIVFTDNGIEHKIFGVRYRFTSWKNVKNIMHTFHPSENTTARALVITTDRGDIYLPNDYGRVSTKGKQGKDFIAEWLSGKIFVVTLPQRPEERGSKVVQYVADCYGPLDFDYSCDRTAPADREPATDD